MTGERMCVQCGLKPARKGSLTCSTRCALDRKYAAAAKRAASKAGETRTCQYPGCGKDISQEHRNAIYCPEHRQEKLKQSRQASNARYAERRKAARHAKVKREVCARPGCGNMIPEGRALQAKFCCNECTRLYHAERYNLARRKTTPPAPEEPPNRDAWAGLESLQKECRRWKQPTDAWDTFAIPGVEAVGVNPEACPMETMAEFVASVPTSFLDFCPF